MLLVNFIISRVITHLSSAKNLEQLKGLANYVEDSEIDIDLQTVNVTSTTVTYMQSIDITSAQVKLQMIHILSVKHWGYLYILGNI